MWPRVDVLTGPGTDPDSQIRISVAEGVGRLWNNVPTVLGVQATRTRAVVGFPNGGLYMASQACPCPQVTQLFKRNTRIRVQFDNLGADAATIRYTIAGCQHYTSECPPGRAMDRIRSLEPTIGPNLAQEPFRCPPFQTMQPVPGQGFQPVRSPVPYPQGPRVPLPAVAPGPPWGPMQVPLPAGGGVLTPQAGGPYAYLQKYYARDPQTGAVVPIHGAAHGFSGNGGHQWGRI